MARRPPSAPPVIPGYEHVKLVGSGGFADVFLYQQQHPRRQVAIKVLLAEYVGKSTAEAFTAEANLMAQLASHPSIVSIYGADVASDGRPYLVMEYLSKPNLQARHRRERFSEIDTLRIGIQIAGAVETAHREGILHRDIKPANILVTNYDRPALTDFGISATTTDQMAGLSVPWSPPEAFSMPPLQDARSDVYSLAATLYTLLTDRSPFEVAGASNSEIDVIMRIQTAAVPAIARHDVSPALEGVLARALAKDPAQRPQSALEFARDLQRVQISLGMQPTPVDVVEDEVVEHVDDDGEERTRFRGITSIDAQESPRAETSTRWNPGTLGGQPTAPTYGAVPPNLIGAPPAATLDATRMAGAAPYPTAPPVGSGSGAPVGAETVMRPAPPVPVPVEAPAPRSRRGLVVGLVAAVVVAAAVGIVIAVVLSGGGEAPETQKPAASEAPLDVVDEQKAPYITGLAGRVDGASAVFTWTNPDPQPGDTYLWRPIVPGEKTTFASTNDPTVTLPAQQGTKTCIEVVVRRSAGASTVDGVEGCTQ